MGLIDGRGRWYRWDKKDTVDGYLALDVSRFAKSVDLGEVSTGRWVWTWTGWGGTSTSTIGYANIPGEGVRLSYRANGQDVDPYLVPVVWTTPNYGGKRPWWLCPNTHCGRRCRILYGGRYYLCRECHKLTYRTQQEGKLDACMTSTQNRMRQIQRKLGGDGGVYDPLPSKPSGMHWKTYWRLAGEYERLQLVWQFAFAQGLGALTGFALETDLEVGDVWRSYRVQRRTDPDAFIRSGWASTWTGFDDPDAERLTLGELAQLAGVPYAFAQEAQREDLVRPDAGRGKRRKRYRQKLTRWLGKLKTLRDAGLTWDEIRNWTKRRWEPGHEHERAWPDGVTLA